MSEGHHGHDHPTIPHAEGPPTHYQAMEIALREVLVEKGVFTAAEVAREVEAMEGRDAGTGARMAARAWLDPDYKAFAAREHGEGGRHSSASRQARTVS